MSDIMREIQRRAWERGATAGNFAVAYESIERDDDGAPLAPDGVLSGEWAGESIPELIPESRDMSDDDAEQAFELYEGAYADGFVALATWAESDDEADAPTNPFEV